MAKSALNNQAGFTLIETLVAITILMMMIFIGTFGYQTYSVYWQKELGDFRSDLAEVRGVITLQRLIRNIKPIVFKGGNRGGYVYFEGGDSLIRAISNVSIASEDTAVAFEINVVQLDSGMVKLVYREYPIATQPLLSEDDIGDYQDEITIINGFEDIRFEYYGWQDYNDYAATQQLESNATFDKKWFGLYSAKDTLISPEQIKVRFKRKGVWSELKIPVSHFLHRDLLQYVGVDL
ncbi:prepilin-type N-terminal cleavage/methylation domain-containing protein [Planctobacterium marinum]|uniref:Prepilin-type N-terminal cleavage/methylation domain-containing protein n=1 Tax=Planctobacterium marinum TaxID=1631968 RepID=A0AA48HMU2_9ALTE|nr:hypothetical protein MACH26_32120 [Planctobacterium marinum]